MPLLVFLVNPAEWIGELLLVKADVGEILMTDFTTRLLGGNAAAAQAEREAIAVSDG